MPHSIGHSSTRTHPNRPRTWAGSTGQTRKSTGRARCTHCDSTSTRKQHAHIGRYCSAMRSKRNESRTPSRAAPHARIRTAQEHGQTPKGWRERASEARAATAGRAPPGEEERIRPANARGGAETALTRTEHDQEGVGITRICWACAGVRRHALIETKGTPSLGMFERSPTVSRDLRNEGSHVSRADAIHCKRKRPLRMHPPVPAVPSRAVWRPHLSLCSPDTSSTTLSFRTLAGRRRWRERGGPGYSTRSEKAPACHLQRAARQRAAHRQNDGQGGPHCRNAKVAIY